MELITAAIKRVVELEAKNTELEKHNEMLAHQLKYAENLITEIQSDKFEARTIIKELEAKNVELVKILELYTDNIFELENKFQISVKALELIGGKMEYYCAIGDHSKQCAAQEALAAINMEGA
jgi:predicted RNase H-like nuclease (RuvC/YqgF family)